MKNFLAIYLGWESPEAMNEWNSLDEKTRTERERAGIDAWGKWVAANKKSIVDTGSPLGKTMKSSKEGISKTKNLMTAYTVVQAETHEAAAELFKNHPHFSIFPGQSIEIMECLPIPMA